MRCSFCETPLPDLRVICLCGQDPWAGFVLQDKHKLLGKIAQGGMGIIYRAIDLKTNELCVIKISRWSQALQEIRQMEPDAARQEERARIEREFILLQKASSQSPHVVKVFEPLGEDPRIGLYYPMEFLDGLPLSKIPGFGQPMPPLRVLPLIAQLGEAISAAHSLGVVHRDLNADNLFIVRAKGKNEFVKVIDFGIARNLYDRRKLFVTGDNMAFGHLHFLAPEQVGYSPHTGRYDRETAARLDLRADIYSIGVIMFIMLTGTPPFLTDTLEGLANRIWENPPNLERALDEGLLPNGLDEIIKACLQADPEQRPTDIYSLNDMLSRLLQQWERNPLQATSASSASLTPLLLTMEGEEESEAPELLEDFEDMATEDLEDAIRDAVDKFEIEDPAAKSRPFVALQSPPSSLSGVQKVPVMADFSRPSGAYAPPPPRFPIPLLLGGAAILLILLGMVVLLKK